MKPISVGLLPLYLKLYDDTSPQHRAGVERFRDTITAELQKRGLAVEVGPVCRVRDEFSAAVRRFESLSVDAIITLHLAYSPSEESADVLAATPLPVIVLDTTPTFDFSPQQNPDEVMYNHGIHGVQDLCNLLIRHGKGFQIEAGHWQKSDVLDRIVHRARGAHAAAALRSARVGQIGQPFKGMGDFAVPESVMREAIGITLVPAEPALIGTLAARIDAQDVAAEIEGDRAYFTVEGVTAAAHERTAAVSLAVRQWIEQERLTAFTVNFMEATQAAGLPTMPFLEAGKAMARGIGYAGEGDSLTAALVGALATTFDAVTFTEMFCPDWANNTIFLSHMGEMNVALVEGKPRLVQKDYTFIDTQDPVLAVGRFRSGKAVFVNLAPGPESTFTLIIAPVTLLDVTGTDRFDDSIRGWMKTTRPIANFLKAYSQLGGTHHAALVYGDAAGSIASFGECMKWKVVMLE